MTGRIHARNLDAIFRQMDDSLPEPAELSLIGGSVVALLGHERRYTHDIDVWAPASTFNPETLRRAAFRAGLGYDLHDLETDDVPYLQIVSPDTANLPAESFWAKDRLTLWQGARLTITSPPACVIAASKMARATDEDYSDVMFLIGNGYTDIDEIIAAAKRLPDPVHREAAIENMVVLEVALNHAQRPCLKATGTESMRMKPC